MKRGEIRKEDLEQAVEHLEEEARMVLPGIQALFGFQLIAVFNQRFTELGSAVQAAHFVAILASAFAVLLVLTPAAYHRQAEPAQVSARFCRIGTFCLTFSLLPLCAGTALDIFVIAEVLHYGDLISVIAGAASFAAFFAAWFIFPRLMRKYG